MCMNTIEPIFCCKTRMKNIIWDFLKRLHFHFSHNFFLNCKPYYIQYSVCILYVCSIGRKEMLQAHTPLHYDLNICKRHWVTFYTRCVGILYEGYFNVCNNLWAMTLLNLFWSITNFLTNLFITVQQARQLISASVS